ncbi:hypothetical protein D6C86_02985 [Aureobasidium pullulans]|nr:hypothetical protein D6C86_02985 [Aureobasidium pullulans]
MCCQRHRHGQAHSRRPGVLLPVVATRSENYLAFPKIYCIRPNQFVQMRNHKNHFYQHQKDFHQHQEDDYEHEEGSGYYGPKAETGDLYDQEAHIDQYAEAYINKHEEAYLDKHKETHLDKHKEIYLDEHDEACIDQHEEGYNYDINEREASHIGKLKEAHDNHDEASNNQSQGFNFKHQESFNNQLKEMSTSLLLLYCHSAEITIMVQVIAPAWKHSNSVREPAKLKASFPEPTARRRPYQ